MGSSSHSNFSPASLIQAARAAHPAFRYAIVVAGLAAIVAVVHQFGLSPATLVFGVIILVGLMVVFFVFAQAVTIAKVQLALPALVLTWTFLLLGLGTSVCLFSSVFFNRPLPLRNIILKTTSDPHTQNTFKKDESDKLNTGPVEPHQIIIHSLGDNTVEFSISINDVPVGFYSSNFVIADITRFIKPGLNQVHIEWTADPNMSYVGFAELIIQVQQGRGWTRIISRKVTKDTKAGASTARLQARVAPQ